jgi:hypothetical protein
MHTPRILFSAIALALLVGAAPDADQAGGRYRMTPAEGGAFLRLDTQTGAMSVCQRKGRQMGLRGCARRAPERWRTEIDRLKSEVRRLEELLALPDPGTPDGKRAQRSGPKLSLPSEEDIDRAMDYAQRMMRKFKERMREFQGQRPAEPLGGAGAAHPGRSRRTVRVSPT